MNKNVPIDLDLVHLPEKLKKLLRNLSSLNISWIVKVDIIPTTFRMIYMVWLIPEIILLFLVGHFYQYNAICSCGNKRKTNKIYSG